MSETTHTISPLRQRMIDDMRLRKFSPKIQAGYIRAVKRLAGYLGRSPDTATVEDLRRFQLHLLIANAGRRDNLAKARELLNVPPDVDDEAVTGDSVVASGQPTYVCPDCGATMMIIETVVRGQRIRAPPRLQGAS